MCFFIWFWWKNRVQCFIGMPSYKIHSIKNNKKLSFIIEWENAEKVKNSLSLDGFIVLTVDQLEEEKNTMPRFTFEALKENKSRIEWRVDALDIFSAYQILRDDYQYKVLKLYPIDVTDEKEQEMIFKNILEIFPETNKNEKEKEVVKSKTFTEIDILKKFLEILTKIVSESDAENKDILLYDIKRVQLVNSISSIEEVIKKTVNVVYNKGSIEQKRKIYKFMIPITKKLNMLILPPWFFATILEFQNSISIMKILFWDPEKEAKKNQKKAKNKEFISKILERNNIPEKKIFTNKNIFILLKKQYRSSWLDIFKEQGSYLYIYSLLRQYRPLFWVTKIQEYIGMTCLYSSLFLVGGVIFVGGIFTTEFLFFNGFLFLMLCMVVLSLVFFFKEI